MATVFEGYEGGLGEPTSAKPTKDLIGDFFTEGQRLLRAELQLAKAELREEGQRAGKAAGMFGAAAGMAIVAGLMLTATITLLLATFLPAWFAALLVTLGIGAGALILAKTGKAKWDLVRGPEKTMQALKEDGEWARQTLIAAKSQLRAHA